MSFCAPTACACVGGEGKDASYEEPQAAYATHAAASCPNYNNPYLLVGSASQKNKNSRSICAFTFVCGHHPRYVEPRTVSLAADTNEYAVPVVQGGVVNLNAGGTDYDIASSSTTDYDVVGVGHCYALLRVVPRCTASPSTSHRQPDDTWSYLPALRRRPRRLPLLRTLLLVEQVVSKRWTRAMTTRRRRGLC